jgi:hypothetical protein
VPFLTSGSLFSTSIGNPINMNSLTTWPIPYRLQLVSCPYDRISSHRPTPASSSPNLSPSSDRASLRKQYDRSCPSHSLSLCDRSIPSFRPCDRPFSGSDFGPCDRPTHGPSDRPPQCKTLSLRRESAKRSACLSTVPSVQTFGANWPNDAALNFWVCDSFLSEIAIKLIR